MIEVKGLKFIYQIAENKRIAISRISLQINKGEFLAILGHNGSGKSTLAKLLNGLLKPTEGTVIVDGLDTRETKNLALIRQRVGFLFQNPENQIVAPIVEEDVAFGPENLGLPPEEIRLRVQKALDMVGLSHYRKHPVQFLSGGQKQCVAIAGLLAMEPEYLVLDEPTAMLDPVGRKRVLEIVLELRNRGVGIIYITHHLEEAILAQRLVLMEKGQLVMDEPMPKALKTFTEKTNKGDLPPLFQLIGGLRQNGFSIPEEIKTAEELVNYLAN